MQRKHNLRRLNGKLFRRITAALHGASAFCIAHKLGLKIFLVVLITSLGVGLRLYAAPRLSIDVDERIYFQAALQYADAMREGHWNMLVFNNYNAEHPPFYKIIYGVALLTQPRLEHFNPQAFIDGMAMYKIEYSQWGLVGRYVSVVFGGLTILVLAVLNPLVGLTFAIDTLAVQFNSTMFLESLPVLTSLLCALCYLRWWNFRQSRDDHPRSPTVRDFAWICLSAGFLGMTVASKYTYAVVGLAIAIHFVGSVILKKIRAVELWKLFLWSGLALVAFYICDPYLWKHPIAHLLESINFHLNHPNSDRAQIVNLPFYQPLIWFSAPFYKFSGNAYAIFPLKLDTLIGLLALAGLPRLAKRQPLYLIWVVIGLVVLMAWPTKWVQYAMIILTPLSFSAAAGVEWAWDQVRAFFGFLLRRHRLPFDLDLGSINASAATHQRKLSEEYQPASNRRPRR